MFLMWRLQFLKIKFMLLFDVALLLFILWNADSGGIVQWLNKVMFEVVIQTALRLEEVFSVLKNVDVLLDSPVCSEAWRARKRAQSTRKTRDMSCLPMPFITNTASKASSESIPLRVSWFTPPPIAPLPRPQSAFDKDFQGECFGRMAATTSVDLSSSTRAPMVTSAEALSGHHVRSQFTVRKFTVVHSPLGNSWVSQGSYNVTPILTVCMVKRYKVIQSLQWVGVDSVFCSCFDTKWQIMTPTWVFS